jgi:hypothetical protein
MHRREVVVGGDGLDEGFAFHESVAYDPQAKVLYSE